MTSYHSFYSRWLNYKHSSRASPPLVGWHGTLTHRVGKWHGLEGSEVSISCKKNIFLITLWLRKRWNMWPCEGHERTKWRKRNPSSIAQDPLIVMPSQRSKRKKRIKKYKKKKKKTIMLVGRPNKQVEEAINRPQVDHSYHLIVEFYLSCLLRTCLSSFEQFSSRVCTWLWYLGKIYFLVRVCNIGRDIMLVCRILG